MNNGHGFATSAKDVPSPGSHPVCEDTQFSSDHDGSSSERSDSPMFDFDAVLWPSEFMVKRCDEILHASELAGGDRDNPIDVGKRPPKWVYADTENIRRWEDLYEEVVPLPRLACRGDSLSDAAVSIAHDIQRVFTPSPTPPFDGGSSTRTPSPQDYFTRPVNALVPKQAANNQLLRYATTSASISRSSSASSVLVNGDGSNIHIRTSLSQHSAIDAQPIMDREALRAALAVSSMPPRSSKSIALPSMWSSATPPVAVPPMQQYACAAPQQHQIPAMPAFARYMSASLLADGECGTKSADAPRQPLSPSVSAPFVSRQRTSATTYANPVLSSVIPPASPQPPGALLQVSPSPDSAAATAQKGKKRARGEEPKQSAKCSPDKVAVSEIREGTVDSGPRLGKKRRRMNKD